MNGGRPVLPLGRPGRLQALADTGLAAAPDPVFDRFADMVCTALGVPVALVSLVDPDRQFFPGAVGLGQPWADARETPLSHSFCQQVVASAEPLIIVDARDDQRVCDNPAIGDLGVVGYAGMPLVDGAGSVLGSLCAIDHRPRRWTATELKLLKDLAAACSDSLQLRIANRHAEAAHASAQDLTRQLRVAFDRSQLLLSASVALSGCRTIGDVLAATRHMVDSTFDPVNIGVVLLDEHGELRVATSEPLPAFITERWATIPVTAPVPAAQVFRTGRLMALADPDAIATAFPSGVTDLRRLGWQAIACAPIPGIRGTLGVLTLAWQHPHEVSIAEQAVIASIAGYAGQAIERVQQLDRQNTAAATLQTALLTPLPKVGHLSMAARYLPAHHEDHVGGDWYDAVALPGDRLALVIGDTTGHSMDAAAAMSELRSMLRGFLVDRAEPPSALLRRLEHANRALTGNTIATVLVGYLDPGPADAHLLTWSNAGHPPPSVISPDGTVVRLSGADPLIGVNRHAARSNRTHLVPGGATVLLHTDGLVERRSETLDEGFARLDRLLRDHRGLPPSDLADRLVQHAEDQEQDDDVALLVIRTPVHHGDR